MLLISISVLELGELSKRQKIWMKTFPFRGKYIYLISEKNLVKYLVGCFDLQ